MFGFHKHEPDSKEYIEQIPENTCFLDIGANVGTYTVYAALRGDIQVLAFEPNAMNFFSTFNNNIEINGVADKALAYANAFAGQTGLDTLNMSKLVEGDVAVQFGRGEGPLGDPPEVRFHQ